MTDDLQTLRDDIAYLKDLADAGRNGSTTGGFIMAAAGTTFGIASLFQWAALSGAFGGTQTLANWAWIVSMGVFFTILFLAKRRQGAAGETRRPTGLAWQGIGWAIFCIFVAISIATWRTQSPVLITFVPSIIFTLYGAAWMVPAAMSNKAWLWLTALGSFAMALVNAWFIGQPVAYLIYAIGLFLLAALPGLILMRTGKDA